MIALFVAGLETPTRRLVASVSFIAVGTALASAGRPGGTYTPAHTHARLITSSGSRSSSSGGGGGSTARGSNGRRALAAAAAGGDGGSSSDLAPVLVQACPEQPVPPREPPPPPPPPPPTPPQRPAAPAGEVNLSLPGMLIMFLSELFESIRLVMTQLLLTGLRFHPSESRRCGPPGRGMLGAAQAGAGGGNAAALAAARQLAARLLNRPSSRPLPPSPAQPAHHHHHAHPPTHPTPPLSLPLLPVEGLMYLAPACTFWLALGSLLLELRPMLAAGAFGLMAQRPGAFLAAAAMGFAVNSLAYIVIQVRG